MIATHLTVERREHQLEPVPHIEDLVWCPVCRGAEGSLPTECPGVRMEPEVEARVLAGAMDYRDGAWVNRDSRGLLIRLHNGLLRGCPAGAVPGWGDTAERWGDPVRPGRRGPTTGHPAHWS